MTSSAPVLLFTQSLPLSIWAASSYLHSSVRKTRLYTANPTRRRIFNTARNSKPQIRLTQVNRKQPQGSTDESEEEKQKDKSYALREFGKVSAGAILIGLVLFFFDILVSLVALSIGLVYAIAVLFEVRGADVLLTRIGNGASWLWSMARKGICRAWRAWRSWRKDVRKRL
ncbi:unnamed protein product [Agarophyton chilense]